MKTPFLMALSAIILAGCSTTDLNRISSEVVNGAAQTVWNSAGLGQSPVTGGQAGRTGSGSYSVERENLATHHASRAKRDYGKVELVRTEKNPDNRTIVVLDSCSHPAMGKVSCMGSLYPVTPEGWLADNNINLGGAEGPRISLIAGNYYFKMNSVGNGPRYYSTGELQIQPLVTHYGSFQVD